MAWVLAGLCAGVLLGILAARLPSSSAMRVVNAVEPVGTLFVNAIRMAVIPLVVASVIGAITSVGDTRRLTRLGVTSLIVFVALAVVAASLTAVIALPLVRSMAIDVAAANALGSSNAPTEQAPAAMRWLTDLVPANPIAAAANGALLPLIVFTICFGVALTNIGDERRVAVVNFFGGVADAMLVLIGWVIRLAPLGVFALAAPLAARLGVGLARAMLGYIVLAPLLTLIVLAVFVYPATCIAGRVGPRRFLRACAPAQALAVSSRSTMACLPAMIEASSALGVDPPVTQFVVPLAAAMCRVGSAVGQTLAVLFAARLFNVEIGALQLVAVVFVTVLTTFTVPGIPGGSILVMVPVLVSAGVPAEAVGVLLGADAIPDMLRTLANVTGGVSAAAIIGRVNIGDP